METLEKPISELTTAELEALLAGKKKKEAQEREKEVKAYESMRNDAVINMMGRANSMYAVLKLFKDDVHEAMSVLADLLAEYGEIRSNSKGGFSVTSADGSMRITRRRDTEPLWDERGTKAMELIKDFLHDTVKKKDQSLFEILLSFLERNKAGELEYARVFQLMQHEDKYTDPRWTEGLKLLKESYSTNLKGYGYEFKTKNEAGKWETLILNFSSI